MKIAKLGLFCFALLQSASFTSTVNAQQASGIEASLQRNSVDWAGRTFQTSRLREGYKGLEFKPIWMTGNQLNKFGLALIEEIEFSYRDGLDPAEYLAGLNGATEAQGDQDAVRLELALSNAFLTLGYDLFSGITTPSVTDPNIIIKRKNMKPGDWLEGVAWSGPKEMFSALRPAHPQYAQLRQMLNGYRSLLARGGWDKVEKGETLKPGMSSPRVNQIRQNLTARGYDSLVTDQLDFYDDGLKEALIHFQRRHGLSADGVAGPNTFKALSVSAEQRVKQLSINLERWRWLPRDLGINHVLVNQAGFELFMMKGKKVVDQRRVIVGKPFHQSPMFSDTIVYSEFNPTWTVPRSIAGKEMLPKIRNNPAYLQDKGYDLYKSWGAGAKPINPFAIDWSTVSARKFPYRIVQGPGPRNALGRVKFIFPNKFSVYLHDTPSRSLFARTGRAFSHGCIRVHKPLEFAKKIYQMQGGLNSNKIQSIIDSKKQTRINLKRKLPIHLAYFTAWVDENGVPLFFDDVYKRDKLVAKYMF